MANYRTPIQNLIYKTVDDKIHDEEIKSFVKTALDNAPYQFWADPCSGSGKYHPPEDQGNGGVVRHIIKCASISDELSNFYNLSQTNRDVTMAGTVLHDIQKNGIPWGNMTHYEHGKIGAEWLAQFSLREPDKTDICNCVRYHMYRWCSPESEIKIAINPTITESIVQLSDFFCSRKCASFLPGIELSETQINSYF